MAAASEDTQLRNDSSAVEFDSLTWFSKTEHAIDDVDSVFVVGDVADVDSVSVFVVDDDVAGSSDVIIAVTASLALFAMRAYSICVASDV